MSVTVEYNGKLYTRRNSKWVDACNIAVYDALQNILNHLYLKSLDYSNYTIAKLPEYGKLKKVRRDNVITIIDWLIENRFILKTKHPTYPVLHPTYEGMHYDETITANNLKKLLNILQKREV